MKVCNKLQWNESLSWWQFSWKYKDHYLKYEHDAKLSGCTSILYFCCILSFVCCTNQCEWLSWVKLLLCDLKFFRCTVYVCMKTFKDSCLQIEKNNLLWRTQWLHYCSQKAYFIDILFFLSVTKNQQIVRCFLNNWMYMESKV